MPSTRQRILRRARGLRKPRSLSIDTDVPPVPPLPFDLPASPATTTTTFSTMSSLPLPDMHYRHGLPSTDFLRHSSTSSGVSQVSSCWSSASSSASTSSLSSASSHGFNPLRMHPAALSPAATGLYFNDDGLPELRNSGSTISVHAHGFDFGFMAKPRTAGPTIRLVAQPSGKRYMLDIEVDDEDDDDLFDDFAYVRIDEEEEEALSFTPLSPPPHQSRPRVQQSEAPTTPTAASVNEPTSPVRPRVQPGNGSDMVRYLKRGDWKRRGIVFGNQEA